MKSTAVNRFEETPAGATTLVHPASHAPLPRFGWKQVAYPAALENKLARIGEA